MTFYNSVHACSAQGGDGSPFIPEKKRNLRENMSCVRGHLAWELGPGQRGVHPPRPLPACSQSHTVQGQQGCRHSQNLCSFSRASGKQEAPMNSLGRCPELSPVGSRTGATPTGLREDKGSPLGHQLLPSPRYSLSSGRLSLNRVGSWRPEVGG